MRVLPLRMASTLRESEYVGVLRSPEEMLALWQQVEVDIATVGQAYNAPGGVNVTLADMGMVRARIQYWTGRVLAKRGLTPGRNYGDLNGDTSDNLGSTD